MVKDTDLYLACFVMIATAYTTTLYETLLYDPICNAYAMTRALDTIVQQTIRNTRKSKKQTYVRATNGTREDVNAVGYEKTITTD